MCLPLYGLRCSSYFRFERLQTGVFDLECWPLSRVNHFPLACFPSFPNTSSKLIEVVSFVFWVMRKAPPERAHEEQLSDLC